MSQHGSALSYEPSGDPEVLTKQLLAALPGGQNGMDNWRRYFCEIVAQNIRAVAQGKLDAPERQHRRMHVFLPFFQDNSTGDGEARTAASELLALIGVLETQAHALRVPRLEQTLRGPESLEYHVLAVLLGTPDPLDLAAVHAVIPQDAGAPDKHPAQRVYLVLRELVDLGLIISSGDPQRYRLWGTGRDLCVRAGVHAPVAASVPREHEDR